MHKGGAYWGTKQKIKAIKIIDWANLKRKKLNLPAVQDQVSSSSSEKKTSQSQPSKTVQHAQVLNLCHKDQMSNLCSFSITLVVMATMYASERYIYDNTIHV